MKCSSEPDDTVTETNKHRSLSVFVDFAVDHHVDGESGPVKKHFLQPCLLRYHLNRNRMLYKYYLPKNPVDFFLHSRKTKAVVLVKEPDKNREKFFFIFKMAHFTSQNGPFCSAK